MLCKNHTKFFKQSARAFEPWALKMVDASSKLQAGLLLGNLAEYGSYSQCLRIFTETEYGPLLGKHCFLKIWPSKKLILQVLKLNRIEDRERFTQEEMFALGWSVCVPYSCPVQDVLNHFNKTIREITVGVDLEITLDENYCRSVLDYPVLDFKEKVLLFFYSLFILIGIIAALVEIYYDSDNLQQVIVIFSAYRNCKKISKTEPDGKYDFFYGLRFLSSGCVIMGHRYIMYMVFPTINSLDELVWPTSYSSLLILGSSVSVDSFFLISAMFVSMGFFDYVEKTGSFNILSFYMVRYLRITLPLALVMVFYMYLVQFFADGPYAYDVYLLHQKPCRDYWWSTLLHVQTLINPGELCLYPIWYLSCEMPFYFLSPIVLYPMWRWPKVGFTLLLGLYLFFSSFSFYLAWTRNYDGTPLPVTNQLLYTDYFKEYYVAPHIRAPPYLLGLLFGYFIRKYREGKVNMPPLIRILGWIISFTLLVVSLGGCRNFYQGDHKYNPLEAASYLAFSRSSWSLGLMWLIWCCMFNSGGILQEFLSAYIFKVLGRLTYGMFLIHSIVQVYKGGSSKVSSHFSNFNAIFDGMADITLSILISFVFTLFYEMPLVQIQTTLFRTKSDNAVKRKIRIQPKN
ncbi:nose resistant to fluoxetine protein 6-like [Sitophilus oryzae]|uniref:Nose resistant to fluoxetine protein 6-like n=1 Tax=Sitophilus oryzae TaxID=7048 RepID=A0A6J2YE37_SITOR|nr:nose resistant to fluoxetine protein 6-like [Sitophilus oryzae]